MARRLYRSQRERIIGGVAGGVGEYFDIDPVWVRLAFILLVFASGVGLIAYIVLWIIVPRQASQAAPREAIRENIQDLKQDLKQAEAGLKEAFGRKEEAPQPDVEARPVSRDRNIAAVLVGLVLIGLGVIFFLGNFIPFWWFSWGKFWPVLLILAGVVILVARIKRK